MPGALIRCARSRLQHQVGLDQTKISSTPACDDAMSATPRLQNSLMPLRRLWFVRMPKPAEDSSTAAVEAEVEGYRMQVQLLNESLTIKRVRKCSTCGAGRHQRRPCP